MGIAGADGANAESHIAVSRDATSQSPNMAAVSLLAGPFSGKRNLRERPPAANLREFAKYPPGKTVGAAFGAAYSDAGRDWFIALKHQRYESA